MSVPVLLSSRRIPDPRVLEALLPVALPDSAVAVVPNGRDGLNEVERTGKVEATLAWLSDFGARTVLLDLRKAERGQVWEALADTTWCWVMGGDPFVLRRAMAYGAFDEQVVHRVEAGYTYAGESAGAIVAGLSLQGFDIDHDLDGGSSELQRGLGLVDAVVLPHARSHYFAESIRNVRTSNRGLRFLEIGDEEQYSSHKSRSNEQR